MKKLAPENWLSNYGDYLFGYANSRVSDRAIAEDLVQDTFLSAFKARERFEGRASEKTWLMSILKNKIIDHYRKTLVKDPDQSGKKETPISYFNTDGTWDLNYVGTDWRIDASSQLESKEFFGVFQKCLSSLTGKSKHAFQLKYIDGEKSEDICKELDISPTNYWVIIHRAKIKLRNCLDSTWFNND